MRSRQAAQHEVAGGRETAVEVHGGDDRLERVGEDRLLGPPARRVLALAEQQVRAEVELLRDLGEHARVHDAGAHLRQLAFGQLREVLEHVVRDDEAEHGVAEELEPLVRLGDRSCSAHHERCASEPQQQRRGRRTRRRASPRARRDPSAPPHRLDRRAVTAASRVEPSRRARPATHSTASRTVRSSTSRRRRS